MGATDSTLLLEQIDDAIRYARGMNELAVVVELLKLKFDVVRTRDTGQIK